MDQNELDSKVVKALRFPLAIMVVAIHSFIPNDGNYVISAFSHVLSHIAVPLFFLFSGYYFFTNADGWSWNTWNAKMKKRFNTLVVPYFLWILLFIVFSMAPTALKSILTGSGFYLYEWTMNNGGMHMFWDSYTWNLDRVDLLGNSSVSSAPILVPFWFLRDLIVTVVFTPAIFFFVKDRAGTITRYIPFLFLALLGLVYVLSISFVIPGVSSTALFFFSCGAFLQVNNYGLVKTSSLFGKCVVAIATILLIIETIYDGNNSQIGSYFYKPWVICGVISALVLMRGGI